MSKSKADLDRLAAGVKAFVDKSVTAPRCGERLQRRSWRPRTRT